MPKQDFERPPGVSLNEWWGYEPGSPADQSLKAGRGEGDAKIFVEDFLKALRESREKNWQKNWLKGLEEGRKESSRRIVTSMAEKGLNAQAIAELTGIAIEDVVGILEK